MRFLGGDMGIAGEHRGRIFEPCYTACRGQGGTELGLNVVHNNLTKQFAGTILVQTVPGGDTPFTMRFPRVSPQLERASRATAVTNLNARTIKS